MNNSLERKFNLFTAICMVVGTVIGSGVFFKAQVILDKTEGNMPLGILAWIIGGIIMILCTLAFAGMAQKYEKVNGLVDYAEVAVGKGYAYYVGWFMTTIYLPTLTTALAWLSARYTLVFITSCYPDFPLIVPASEGGAIIGPECMALTMFYLVLSYGTNALSPKIAGKFQNLTVIIKFIPLLLMAVVGIIAGLLSPTKMLVSNFTTAVASTGDTGTMAALLAAVCATAFAYEGWIITTSINAELKDSKKNLPRALVIGAIIVIITYVLYYIGVAGGASVDDLRAKGATTAFVNVFGGVFGNILNLFVAISCMGTMNGLMLGCTRGIYALAARDEGPKPKLFKQVDPESNMTTNSAILGLIFCAAWGLYFYLSNLAQTWTGPFVFDPTELPIITIYAMYIPIFIMWMVKEREQTFARRYLIPIGAILSSLFMIYASIVGHGMANVWYLIVFAVFMFAGFLFKIKTSKAKSK
jgi:APA family basic amino acid/polyamine antiporter